MKKVLVTGAGGFIGSHLVERCVSEGYDVRAFLHYNSSNSWGWLENSDVCDDVEIVCGDIRDYDSVFEAVKGCDAVFHLAALIGIPYSYVSPLAYIRTNIEGTYNVLQASRMLEVSQILTTSTSETYGTAQYVPIDEKHPLVGQSPYSSSKIGADQMAVSYHRSFGLPVKIVRPFNTYGPRQSARAIIPTIITQILAGNNEIKLGSISPTRDLTYVKDTASGFLDVMNSSAFEGEVVNVGSGFEVSIEGLAGIIIKLMGKEVDIVEDKNRIRPANSEVERLYCDNKKLKQYSSWEAQYTLEEGLKETIGWIKDNMKFYKTNLYNI